MSTAVDTPVLIVGAGPTGLMMACELARHGVPFRIVEKNATPTDRSKALGVHARTLEIFDQIGVLDAALAAGRRAHGTNMYSEGKRIAHVAFDEIDSPFPFVEILPQSETERILIEKLRALGHEVERNAEFVSLAQDDDAVTATIRREGGREEHVRVRWLVGCDGAHSGARHAVDLPFEGIRYDETFVLGDLDLVWDLPDDEVHVFMAPDGMLGAFPLPGSGRWRLIADGVTSEPTAQDFEKLLLARGHVKAQVRGAGWLASFKIHRRIVPSYRSGRVFLAGDAAHIHSPIGGQGMNTGLQDAFNLGWKLALVEKGKAHPRLLDSYSAERRPIASLTVQGTDVATRMVMLRHPVAREVRNRLVTVLSNLEVIQARMLATASEIAVAYRKSPIVGEHRAPVAQSQLIADRSTETPSIADWLEFGRGPAPGDRAPDAWLASGERFFSFLRHTEHTLVLFDGAAATPEGYRNFASIAEAVTSRWGDRVRVEVVVPSESRPHELPEPLPVIQDPDWSLHRRFGAGSECLYLVRPDGYIGFRSQPADAKTLITYLGQLFD